MKTKFILARLNEDIKKKIFKMESEMTLRCVASEGLPTPMNKVSYKKKKSVLEQDLYVSGL